jgi:hypothetical protein
MYHLMARSSAEERIFRTTADYVEFVTLLGGSGIACHAFCVLRSHYHVVGTLQHDCLAKEMHRLEPPLRGRVQSPARPTRQGVRSAVPLGSRRKRRAARVARALRGPESAQPTPVAMEQLRHGLLVRGHVSARSPIWRPGAFAPVRLRPAVRTRERGSGRRSGGLARAHLPPQGRVVDVVDEGALAVDLDHGQPLAIAGLQLGVARDVDLRIGEAELTLQRFDLRLGTLAE